MLDAAAWRRIAYLLLAFPLGLAYFLFIVVGLTVALSLALVTLGALVVAVMAVARMLARFERRLAGRLLGEELADPYRPAEGNWWARLLSRAADPATWKDLAYLILDFPLGLADFVVAVAVIGGVVQLIVMPFYFWALPDGVDLFGMVRVATLPVALVSMVVGLALAPLAVRLMSAFASVHALVARTLLTASPDPELSARVVDLRSSRARLVAAADAERRRLERDLHDGAQQRLVAMALQLRMAKDRLARGDDALELVTSAGDEAQKAIAELRDLARGIHPPVLTDRGLEAAISALADRSAIPVTVTADVPERPAAAVETAAYFVAAEALTNAAKHAGASRVEVRITRRPRSLVVEISDDGRGGADPAGSGLRGLRQRVEALDGTLLVVSPPEGGTTLRAELPCAS
ncbi:MAG TPA: sensor histidine kinase [Solirubrobacteraceae bacterium]